MNANLAAKRMLKSLVVMAVAGTLSVAEARSALAQVSVQELGVLLAEDADDDWTEAERRLLARLLAGDTRPAVRFTLAAALSRTGIVLCASEELELIAAIARTPEEPVRRAAAVALGSHLERRAPLERLQILAEWALAGDPWTRDVAARAAAGQLELPAANAVLEHLLKDPVGEVRDRAHEAWLARYGSAPPTAAPAPAPAPAKD